MAEGRRVEINVTGEMEGNYPDSVDSSPRSRENDSDYFGGSGNQQRWEAVDSVTSSTGLSSTRVRLMCSCGGKILPRPHDNQLAYVGGDTRILAVDRGTRFSTMISKLSNVWGSGVSFKYQLPNEDLDSLISVTNDEDLDNMMAEYDRLQKSGYKFSRLRLFVFPARGAEGSGSSLGSVMEESGGQQWFVDALNNPPVNQGICGNNRSDCGSGSEASASASAWVNNMPDYLFGLENNGSERIRKNSGVEYERILPRPSSFDSDFSGSNFSKGVQFGGNQVTEQSEKGVSRNSNSAPIQNGANPNINQGIEQSEKGAGAGAGVGVGVARNSNSAPIQEIPAPQKKNPQPEISERPALPQQVTLLEFQNLQLKHQQQEHHIKQQDHQLRQQDQQIKQQGQQDSRQESYMNLQDQRIKQQDQQDSMQESYMNMQDQRIKQQDQQIKQQDQQDSMQESYMNMQDQRIKQQEQQIKQQDSMQETFMNLPGRKIYPDPGRSVNLSTPGQEVYMHQSSQPEYYRTHSQQQHQQHQHQHQQPVTYWQTHDQGGHGNGQYPVYMVPAGSNMMQTMTAVRPSPGYYNPAQRVNAAPSVYDAPGLVTTVRASVAAVSAAAEVYREQQSVVPPPLQAPPVSNVPGMYAAPMQLPVSSMMYRAPQPVNSMPIAHPESYAYPPQPVVYDPNLSGARQVYYTQAVNTQYHQPPMGPIAPDVNAAVNVDIAAAAAEQVKLGRVSPAAS